MDTSLRRGRLLVFGAIMASLMIELANMVMEFTLDGFINPAIMIRMLILGFLGFLVYRGHGWVRWLLGGGSILQGFLFLTLTFLISDIPVLIPSMMAVLAIISVANGAILLWVPSAVAFLKHQRLRPEPPPDRSLQDQIASAKEKILIILVIMLFGWLASTTMVTLQNGSVPVANIVRLLFTILFGWALYLGQQWARLLFFIGFILGIILVVVVSIRLFMEMLIMPIVVVTGLLVVYGVCLWSLFHDPDIKAYFDHKQPRTNA